MSKKQEIINQLKDFPNEFFNEDQKNIILDILQHANEDNVQTWSQFLFAKRKIGFGFDYSPEVAKGRIITLVEKQKLNINCDKYDSQNENKLIIGDNYNALKALQLTHKSKVDIIYIDPPYNTESAGNDGNNSSSKEGEASKFIYKDKFGRNGWLNLMKDRLLLAKELLSNDGVIFVSIDDTEHAYLKVLMDDIFGEENFITNFIWQKKSGGGQSTSIYEGHEYICFYAKNKNKILKEKMLGVLEEVESKEIKVDEIGRKYYLETDYIRKVFGKKPKELNHRNCFYEELKDWKNESTIYDIEQKIKSKELELVWNEKFNMHFIAKKIYLIDNKYVWKIPYSIIKDIWTSDGKDDLDSLLGTDNKGNTIFDNPKPVKLLTHLLQMNKNKNSLVLDFFAGSGTTGQAVMELNKIDGGNRKFILCTNNENEIAHKVTYERLYRVIKGNGTNNETFPWIESNLPFLNENLRVIEIDDTKSIALIDVDNENNKYDEIIENAIKGIKLLDNNYDKDNSELNIYFDLAALNPLEKK